MERVERGGLWRGVVCLAILGFAVASGCGKTGDLSNGASGGPAAGTSADAGANGVGQSGSSGLFENAGDGSEAAGAPGGGSCAPGNLKCGEGCVDPKFDVRHCGACDTACGVGELCSAGRCGVECLGGSTHCGTRCVDPNFDPENCGACGHACASGEVCSAGHCGSGCTDAVHCGNACVDVLTDSANCGGCGNACSSGQTCINGACGLHCEQGSKTQCGTTCTDLKTDSKNCGACFAACSSDKHCAGGSCVCGDGKSACQGVCTDTKSSAANCGACGAACAVNEACSNSICDCKPGTTRCGGVCLDTKSSAANCGACGAVCAAGKVCTLGVCAAPTSDWPTLQYDVAHGGQNTVETAKPPLTLSWSRKLSVSQPFAPALAGGRLFVTGASYFAATAPILALSLSDGSDLWSYNFGNVSSLGAPSVFENTVYLANGKPTTGNALLWSFDAATGTPNWTAPLAAQWETYWAPVRVGDIVYTNGGNYGGIYGVNALDGTQKFYVGLDQYDEWSPAYFGGKLYTFIAGNFRTHDALTGVVSNTVSVSWNWNGYSMDTAPVFGATLGYVIAPPNLYAIDPVSNAIAWMANGAYVGMPAVAGDIVFGLSAGNLVARDAASGALKWTFVGDTALSYPPVIASGVVYVASDLNLYAVDIASHSQLDHQRTGGWLTLGSGRLIVAAKDGTLTSYLLSN